MYIPNKFRQSDIDCLEKFVRDYPLANLITHSDSGLDTNHIPLLLAQSSGLKFLHGHIAKINPLWKTLSDKSEVLVVFNGPNCYISPNYYPTKKETGKAVPTWNYVTVHVAGVMSFIHDKEWKLDMLDDLTRQHESTQAIPWSTTDAPEDYIQKMLTGIVGLKIEISEINGKWKLSQNLPTQNRQGIVEGLSQQADYASQKISELVKRYNTESK